MDVHDESDNRFMIGMSEEEAVLGLNTLASLPYANVARLIDSIYGQLNKQRELRGMKTK